MHRHLGDRLLSLFNPVRRYGCTNSLCRNEVVLWKSPSIWQRPIVAAAGLAGAAASGALVTGLGLYLASDDTTQAQMRHAYTSVVRPEVEIPPDATLALPALQHLLDAQYQTSSVLETYPRPDDPTAESKLPVLNLAPAPNAAAAQTRDPESIPLRRESIPLRQESIPLHRE